MVILILITIPLCQRCWKQNEVIVFDTSFTHETMNNSQDERFVMIIDFWHPQLTSDEKTSLEFIYDARNKFETDQVEKIDSSWVKEGKPLTVDEYVKSTQTFGKSFVDFFTNGG